MPQCLVDHNQAQQTRYSCEDFPLRATQNVVFTGKRKNKVKYLPWKIHKTYVYEED